MEQKNQLNYSGGQAHISAKAKQSYTIVWKKYKRKN